MKNRFSSQSFLGENTQRTFERAVAGIVGLGGGGSHIAQQLAHIGFLNFVLYDPDTMGERNLNRQVGAFEKDVEIKTPKIEIIERLIKNIRPNAIIAVYKTRWQDNPDPLKTCDIIFGCVDGFRERVELETSARRYLIPYIDIGMDVQPAREGQPPRMAGQVLLSIPGKPCMRCMGFPSITAIEREAADYGAAGSNPQVVWANGVLASTAVGLAVELLTNWSGEHRDSAYFSYDGNSLKIETHTRFEFRATECDHFPLNQVGNPKLTY